MRISWALVAYNDYLRILYVKAEKPQEYVRVLQIADKLTKQALEIQANDLAFISSLLSANCCYFSSQYWPTSAYFAGRDSKERQEKRDSLLYAAVKLVDAARYCERADNGGYFNDFVSLVAAVEHELFELLHRVGITPLLGHLDDAHIETERLMGIFRALAAAAEWVIPVDFMASAGLEKSLKEAADLASYSYDFGDPANANRRLDIALARAAQQVEETYDLDAWVDLAFRCYAGARNSKASREALSSLRRILRSRGERLRTTFRSRGGRLWAAQQLDQLFGELLYTELKELQERQAPTIPSELLYNAEMIKARTLLDLLVEGNFQDFPTRALAEQTALMERDLLRFEPDLVIENETRRARLARFELRLTSRLPIGFEGRDDDSAPDHKRQMQAIENFHRINKAGFQVVAAIVPALQELVDSIQPGEALIEYCFPYHKDNVSSGLFFALITTEGVTFFFRDLDEEFGERISINGAQPLVRSVVGDMVGNLRVAIQVGDDSAAQPLLEDLYDLVIQPIIDAGFLPEKYRRWIIIPHGALHYMPFAALSRGEGHHLIQDVALSVVPSTSVWLNLVKHQRPPLTSFLGCANPDLSATSFEPLPATERELARIARRLASLQCSTFTGKQATEETMRLQAPGKSIIHLATHGDFPEQDAIDLHSILLAPTTQDDGRLNAEKVRQMDLHAARLVVLSICNGGLYRTGPGDELYGLMAALLIAGAENVLGTLWPLDDNTGQYFVTDFYQSLLQHGSAEALRQACLSFIEQKALLKDWANFVLLGTGRPWND